MSASRRRDKTRGKEAPAAGGGGKKPPAGHSPRHFLSADAIREMIESLAVALVLALLIRGFAAEAFVIPTGSMAPALMGRHKDVTCPQCGCQYQVSDSRAVNEESGELTGEQVIAATCPMCRFTMDLRPGNTLGRSYPFYNGDRIVASRFNYELGEPRRWDVAVFHYPMNATQDFIKRVAGLPNETLRIQYGDVWTKPKGASEFSIARKPPSKVLATMQAVYDDEYWPKLLVDKGWPLPWAPLEANAAGGWKAADDRKSFGIDGSAAGEVWLGYRNILPDFDHWEYLLGIRAVSPPTPRPQLIRDFTAYDTDEPWYFGKPSDWRPPPPPPPAQPDGLGTPPPNFLKLGLNWVGDLVVEFELNAAAASGEVLVDLVKGGHHFLCRLDLAKGTAELSIRGVGGFHASAAGIHGPGRHRVRFANVDQQLLLWLDGSLAKFDAPTTYELETADTRVPNEDDLTPARIGSRGAAAEVRHLKLYRDIYYVANRIKDGRAYPSDIPADFDPQAADYPYAALLEAAARPFFNPTRSRKDLKQLNEDVAGFFSNPAKWRGFGKRVSVEFELGADRFFMLGDNSAQSKDGRLWDEKEYYVRRDLLVGRALFVYWPHSWDRIPGTRIPFPYFPNFARMRLIR